MNIMFFKRLTMLFEALKYFRNITFFESPTKFGVNNSFSPHIGKVTTWARVVAAAAHQAGVVPRPADRGRADRSRGQSRHCRLD